MPGKKLSKTSKASVKYHNDGSVWAKGTMVAGKPDGYWEWFRKDGTRMRSGYFEKGKQTGEWTTYDKKGEARSAELSCNSAALNLGEKSRSLQEQGCATSSVHPAHGKLRVRICRATSAHEPGLFCRN